VIFLTAERMHRGEQQPATGRNTHVNSDTLSGAGKGLAVLHFTSLYDKIEVRKG